jgi:hypothetical protein
MSTKTVEVFYTDRRLNAFDRYAKGALRVKYIMMKDTSGEELILTAAATAVTLAKCMDNGEIETFCELLGLLKHDLEIIKFRRFVIERELLRAEKPPQ